MGEYDNEMRLRDWLALVASVLVTLVAPIIAGLIWGATAWTIAAVYWMVLFLISVVAITAATNRTW